MKRNDVLEVWERHLPALEKAFANFAWENREVYTEYLAQTFRYISHSCLLLRFAAERAKSQELKSCLLHHDSEEDGHEMLALNDLKNLGSNLESHPELEITKSVYGTIYNQIEKKGPAAIVGYALALEGLSARRCPEIAQRLVQRYGAQASTLIKLHGHVDPDHIKESFEVLNYFSDAELEIVSQVIIETCETYSQFLLEIEQKGKKQGRVDLNG